MSGWLDVRLVDLSYLEVIIVSAVAHGKYLYFTKKI
jgi:hypothetical protein